MIIYVGANLICLVMDIDFMQKYLKGGDMEEFILSVMCKYLA